MRTRRGLCYPRTDVCVDKIAVKRRDFAGYNMACRKRQRISPVIAGNVDLFDALPDDLVISILSKLSSSASCPSDFINVLITYVHLFTPLFRFLFQDGKDIIFFYVLRNLLGFFFVCVWNRCKRLNSFALQPLVLSKASSKLFAIKAENWSESAHRFLKCCTDAGNVEACYTLGMVSFYFYLLILASSFSRI